MPSAIAATAERSLWWLLLCSTLALGFAFVACADDMAPTPPGEVGEEETEFTEPINCRTCHPIHYLEWQGSVMHYAAASPVFNAFEMTLSKLSNGLFAPNGEFPNFCIQCHSPTGVFNDELPNYNYDGASRPAMDSLSEVSMEGLSCDFCHTVTGPDLEGSPLGDGIANLSLEFAPSNVKVGPLVDSVENVYHSGAHAAYISSSEFCGACHDVRIPVPDALTGEPFQRLENLFTEWQQGPYNSTDNPYGQVVRCQDCHMSLFPLTDPGEFPTMQVATLAGEEMPTRRHAIHAFTAVSFPLVDDERFPNVDTDELDDFGFPRGQVQRREQMLRAACTLSVEPLPVGLSTDSETIPIDVIVTNVGAGHRVPSGFSQERQVWIELVVRDDFGVIYESGYLRDAAHPETGETLPDGLLHDEDLDNRHFEINLHTLDSVYHEGPDLDQRPRGVNLGLVNFQNEFRRQREDGTWEPVVNPLLAETMHNSNSLDMLVPTTFRYDVPMPGREIVGDIVVNARLRYRAFPPEFLRVLAQLEPELVSEATVDRNTIVDMAEDTVSIRMIAPTGEGQ